MNGLNHVDLKQRVLENLLQERNLSRVASKMNLTQQAISEHLRKLRSLFDDRLFIRQGNTMVPTPLAIELGENVSHILLDIEKLLEPSTFNPLRYHGVFTISATDYAIQSILPQFLHALRKEAPNLKIIIRDFESNNVCHLFSSGELDLALTFPEFAPDSLMTSTLFIEQHILIAGINSPLRNRMLSIDEIAELPQLIISPSRANLKGSHDDWFAEKGLKRNIVMSLPSFSAAPDIIFATDLVAFYPSWLLPNTKVEPLVTDFCPPKFEVVAAWHPRTNNSSIHQWVIEKLKNLTKGMDH